MKLKIKATNLSLTPDVRAYLNEKVKALNKFIPKNDGSAALAVEIGRTTLHHQSGDIFKAEFNLHIAGKDLRAVSEKDDLYAALDEVKDEIIRSLKSYKDKEKTLLRRGGAKIKKLMRRS